MSQHRGWGRSRGSAWGALGPGLSPDASPASRALKTRGNTPKYGLIFHSTFIGRAAAKNKGRISRYLANKCTIASRIDCFSGGWGGRGPWRPAGSAVMAKFFVNSISLSEW